MLPRLALWVRRLLGLLAVAMVLTAAGLALVPVDQGARRCGAPAAFLAEGRIDRPDEPPCRDAATDRVATALVLLGGAAVLAIAWAAVADGLDRSVHRSGIHPVPGGTVA